MVEARAAVRVNLRACRSVADVLRGHVIPVDREESELPHLERRLVPNFYFYVVGICHQTSPRGVPPAEGTVAGKRRIGWDFLWSKFEEACLRDSMRLSPETWAGESRESFRNTFADDELGFRLTDLEGRVRLVRDMGKRLIEMGTASVQVLYERCKGRVRTATPNLLSELSRFEAYRDPVEKKSIFFLSLMRNTGLWEFIDPDRLEAPIDYHEIRGHVRIGTVEVVDAMLGEAIHLQKTVSEADDVAIRKATRDAIRIMAGDLGVTPSQAHYLFWNVFRSICLREAPKCVSPADAGLLPERYRALAAGGCPFVQACKAFAAQDFPIEHQTDTRYY